MGFLLNSKEGFSGKNKQSKWETCQHKIAVIFDKHWGDDGLLIPGAGSDTNFYFALRESFNFITLGAVKTYTLHRDVLQIRCLLILLIFYKFKR